MNKPPFVTPPDNRRLASIFRRLSIKTVPVRSVVYRSLFWLGWAVVTALLVVIAARLLAWDDVQIFALADALAAILYLPAWIVAIGAAIGRRWVLLGLA